MPCGALRIRDELSHVKGVGDVKKLQGRGGLRLRVGDFRVIFYTEDQTLIVVAVGDRRDIYD